MTNSKPPATFWAVLPAGEMIAWVEDREALSRGYSRHDARIVAEQRLRALLTDLGVPGGSFDLATRYDPTFNRIEAYTPANIFRFSSADLEIEEGGLIPVRSLVLAAQSLEGEP